MMSSNTFRNSLLASTVVASGLFISAPAFAQVAPKEAAPEVASAAQQSEDESTIVVTGTLIKNPNLVASSPVAVVGAEEIGLRQSNTAEEILRTIPGTVPGIGSNVNNGQGGAATLNLRGLGANRNIVLLNNTRLTPFGLAGTVDTNNIPLAMIERVDILTGGASTTYGADAVAGVVNFITKKDFAGFEADISNSLTERGDGHVVRTELTIGANFDDGRGNATLSVGYQKQDAIYQGARDFGVFALSSTNGGPGGSGTSIPARFSLPARDATAPGGAAKAGTFQIDPTTGSFGTSTAFTPYNYNPTNIYQTPFLRYNIFSQARYEVTPGVEVYAEGMFSKQTVSQIIASSGVFTQALTIRYNNPFIPATALQQICNANGLTAAQCTAAASIPLTTSTPAITSNAAGTANAFVSNVARRFVEAGTRNSDFTTTFFQQKAGVRGSITSTLNFDVFGAYGQSDLSQRSTGQGLLSRLTNELDPTSTTTCRVGGSCVPINLFGANGSISQGALNYINVATTIGTKTSLAQARGVINGDFGVGSPWASNPIGIAVGVEYRKYTAANQSDLPSQTPGEILGAGGAVIDVSGKYDVKEAFAEIIAPIIEDKPFFKTLSLEAGVRRSDYSTSGTNTTWKAGGSWEPVDGVKFRGNYQRAVRAPNIQELFAPVTTGLTNLQVDPCAGTTVSNPNLNNANFRAICIAQGAPAANIGSIAQPSAGQANEYGGGNPNLDVETAKTYTFGGVFQPSFVPGLSITADYYHILVTNAITNPTTNDVLNACFANVTAASATSAACTSIIRDPLTGTFNGSAATVPGLPLALSNLGRILTDGIDLTANYRRDIGFGVLNVGFDGNWTHRSLFQATPTSINRECVGHYSTNCSLSGSIQPKFSWSQRTSLTVGDFDLSLLWRHIDKESVESTTTSAAGVTTQIFGNAVTTVYAPFRTIPSYNYFDFAVRANVSDHLTLTATVLNIGDKKPPIIGANTGVTSYNSGNTYPSTYDALGRAYRVGASIRF